MLTNTEVKIPTPTEPEVTIADLEPGELAVITDKRHPEEVGKRLIKSFDGAVNVEDFSQEWYSDEVMKVIRIPNATVTLTFGKGSQQ